MAIDHERSPLVKPEIQEKTALKVTEVSSPVKVVQEQPEDNEEDELQVESGENLIDDSLKITGDEDEDSKNDRSR